MPALPAAGVVGPNRKGPGAVAIRNAKRGSITVIDDLDRQVDQITAVAVLFATLNRNDNPIPVWQADGLQVAIKPGRSNCTGAGGRKEKR